MSSVCQVCNGTGRLADWNLCSACGGRGYVDAPAGGGTAVLEAEHDELEGSSADVGSIFRVVHMQSYTHPGQPNVAFYLLKRESPSGASPGIYVKDPDYRHSTTRADFPQWRWVHGLGGIPHDAWVQLQYLDGRLLPILLCLSGDDVFAAWMAA